ncbi:hypothetical protein Y032_0198g1604 [Ancylostoma ceylanicum]|uniref:Peptidase A2 domain-containing protein n=1 Tax=Ancylostoma ceylanicum TaxID=53326 RepID=A0A016SNZ1_9BILA|nr:hypothetical protein Y032_0198g1604 [Ancylostoma ceylanicum]
MPIILGAKSLRKFVNFYEESTKSEEYGVESEDCEECRSTTALVTSRLLRIREAKENLQKLHQEMRDEYENCKIESEKRDIMAEIEKIEKESQLQAAIAEANGLIIKLSAKLDKSRSIRENKDTLPGYMDTGAQKLNAPNKDKSEVVQNTVSKVHLEARSGKKNSGGVRQSKEKHSSYRPHYGKGCIFCQKGNHSTLRCRTVSDQNERRKVLRQQNRCWKCFSQTHNSFVCRKQDCTFCGQKHHICLCLKKDKRQGNYGNERRARSIAQSNPNPKDYRNRYRRSYQPILLKNSSATNVQMHIENLAKSSLCGERAKNEQLVLLTAEGSIWNPRKQQYEKILFVFDSGAQKTVVDENLVKQFGLPKHVTAKSSISGIGGRTETFESHVVALKVGTAFGEEIEMTVQTRPVITSGFPSVRLEQDDVTFLRANDIFLANTKLRGETQIPRVLVGLDYYHELVTHSGTRTPSGLHIVTTIFGPTVYGRGLSSVPQPNSVSYNLTAICEKTEHQALQKHPALDRPIVRKEGEDCLKYSGEIFHAYGSRVSSLPSMETATDVANNHSVAVRRIRCPQLQLSAVNSRRRRPALHVKPPFTPSSRRSPSTPALRRRPPRPQAAAPAKILALEISPNFGVSGDGKLIGRDEAA